MKKFLTTMLCIPLCFSAVAFSACGETTTPTPYNIKDYFEIRHDGLEFVGEVDEYISTTHVPTSWSYPIVPKSNVRIKSISGKAWYNPEFYAEYLLPTENWTTDTFVNNFTVMCDVAGCWDFVITPESNPDWNFIADDDGDGISTPKDYIRIYFSTTDRTPFGLTHLVIDFEPVENN